MFVYIWYI